MAIPAMPQLAAAKKRVGAAVGSYADEQALGAAFGYQVDENLMWAVA